MIYCLGIQYKKIEKDKSIAVIKDVREMSNGEFDEYQNCLKVVTEYRNLKNSIYLLKENYRVFNLYLSNPEHGFEQSQSLNLKMNRMLLDANAIFINLLFSLTATKNHFGFLLDDIDKNEYKDKTDNLYKNDDIYGFIWELRNYAQHFFLPFTNISIGEELEQGQTLRNISFKINKNELLNNKNNWKIATGYLNHLPDLIDITNLIQHAVTELLAIYTYFCNKKLKRIDNNLKKLSSWFNEIQKYAVENKITVFHPFIWGLEENQPFKMGKLELELLLELNYISMDVIVQDK